MRPKWTKRTASSLQKLECLLAPKDKTILYFSGSPTVALARLLLESTPGVQSTIVYIETITVSFFQNLPLFAVSQNADVV